MHIAIIADGNRRWAKEHGYPSAFGHYAGLFAIERISQWAIQNKISYLSIYAWSTENWRRSDEEVSHMFDLARMYFSDKLWWYIQNDIRVQLYGRSDRLPEDIVDLISVVENRTLECKSLTLTLMIDYGGRDDIIRATGQGIHDEGIMNAYMNRLFPDPELIVRTGGRHRLSNFLLWQGAYSEILFLDILFPDLSDKDMNTSLDWYKQQIRNFGE